MNSLYKPLPLCFNISNWQGSCQELFGMNGNTEVLTVCVNMRTLKILGFASAEDSGFLPQSNMRLVGENLAPPPNKWDAIIHGLRMVQIHGFGRGTKLFFPGKHFQRWREAATFTKMFHPAWVLDPKPNILLFCWLFRGLFDKVVSRGDVHGPMLQNNYFWGWIRKAFPDSISAFPFPKCCADGIRKACQIQVPCDQIGRRW